jgi:hypothetical protein
MSLAVKSPDHVSKAYRSRRSMVVPNLKPCLLPAGADYYVFSMC